MTGTNPKVDAYFDKLEKWQKELQKLRDIILACGLIEELKWSVPCYTHDGSNVVVINGLKEYCAIGFFKGALLNDPYRVLTAPGENTQSARLMRFTNVKDVAKKESILREYIYEAIELERAGRKVKFKKTEEYPVPEEFLARLNKNAALKKAFYALTPGRQRGYLLHFAAPKQSETRAARVEKLIPQIMAGKGYNEDYVKKTPKKAASPPSRKPKKS